jgi:hypothetical protein
MTVEWETWLFWSEYKILDVQYVEKLHAQTLWGDRGYQNKDLLLGNHMLEVCPCSTTDHQSGSDQGWKSRTF